ncbi:MAG: hypothetical protein ACRC6R_07535 [Bacteroidales bacterium]
METKKLTSQESLDLIVSMMQNSKSNLDNRGGNAFIIWGVTTLMVTLLILLFQFVWGMNPIFNWMYMLIPIVGSVWQRMVFGNRPRVYTQIDKIIKQLWQIILIVTVGMPLLFTLIIFADLDTLNGIEGSRIFIILPFVEVLVVSIGIAITGAIIDFKPSKIGGLVGVVLSIISLLSIESMSSSLFLFILWPIVSMIIPGIKLNMYIKSLRDV